MSLSYYDEHARPGNRLARAMLFVNGAIAAAMAFYWSGFSAVVSEPYRWAMRDGVSLNPSWLEYPYLMLWLVPLLCAFGGWLAIKGQKFTIANIIGCYPVMTLSIMLGWFYLVPNQFH